MEEIVGESEFLSLNKLGYILSLHLLLYIVSKNNSVSTLFFRFSSNLSISYFFSSLSGLATHLFFHGHVSGARQYQAWSAHFLWLEQQVLGAVFGF